MKYQVFKKKLLEERTRLLKDIEVTAPVIGDGHVGYSTHQADDASDVFEQAKNETVNEQLRWLLEEVEHALKKFERHTYGICEICGKEIGEARLEAIPTARYCIEDQQKLSKKVNSS